MAETNQGKVQSRWYKLDTQRTTHLNRARECAKLTIPSLLPPQGADHNTPLPTPYQGLGARAVNNLASKLWMALLPPNTAFFRLDLAPEVEQEIKQMSEGEAYKSDIQASLASIEKKVVSEIDTKGMRTPSFRAIRQLVTTGNTAIYIPPQDGTNHHPWQNKGSGMKTFRLDQFVVVRDPLGNLIELVIKEPVAISSLPEDVRDKIMNREGQKETPEKQVDLYTRVWLEDGKYKVEQEAGGEKIEQAEGEYEYNELPWLVLRWSSDEDYGRGPVEEHLGDFMSLESLSQTIVEGSLAAAKVLFLVNPNGVTRERNLAKARNCDFVPGTADDVSALQMEKYHDFQVASNEKQTIIERLSYAFLLHTAIQRDAERVTAEEIRYMAEELEDALGGVYSVLAQEFQLPLIKLIMVRLTEAGVIPELPGGAVHPVITTGLEALGRNHEQAKLRSFIAEITQTLGPEAAQMYINAEEYIKRAGTNYGIDTEGLVRSNQEVSQMHQQRQESEAMKNATPQVAGELTKGVVENGKQQENG